MTTPMITKMATMDTLIRMITRETPTRTLIMTGSLTVLMHFHTIPMNGRIQMVMRLVTMLTNSPMIDVPPMTWIVMENQILSRKIATLH